MLTRAGVAKRLGRSIATVRRLEGVELHPWVDERGVHRFDAAEVELVRSKDAENSAPAPFSATDDDAPLADALGALSDANQQISHLKERLQTAEASSAHNTLLTKRIEQENQELRATAIEALHMVEALLGSDTPYAVRTVLRSLRRAG